jgi:hypothetical protein
LRFDTPEKIRRDPDRAPSDIPEYRPDAEHEIDRVMSPPRARSVTQRLYFRNT